MKNKKIKVSVIAVAAFAASSAAMAQSSITLYGMLDAGIGYVEHQWPQAVRPRWWCRRFEQVGPQGTEDLGGGLKAIFKIENGFNIGTAA